jgi:hypothetical protein
MVADLAFLRESRPYQPGQRRQQYPETGHAFFPHFLGKYYPNWVAGKGRPARRFLCSAQYRAAIGRQQKASGLRSLPANGPPLYISAKRDG